MSYIKLVVKHSSAIDQPNQIGVLGHFYFNSFDNFVLNFASPLISILTKVTPHCVSESGLTKPSNYCSYSLARVE